MIDVRNRLVFGAVAILAVAAAMFLMTAAISCGVKSPSGDIPILDLAAAIDNPRAFDLAEIAESIELIPIDDSDPRGLMSGASRIAETKSGFYIAGDSRQPVKLFDRSGKFVATRGSIGRGPNEYLNVFAVVADYDSDRVWVVSQSSLVAFDADGALVARNDSVTSLGQGAAWFDGRLMLMRDPPLVFDIDKGPGSAPAPDSLATLVDLFAPDLSRYDGIEVRAKGMNIVLTYDTVGEGVGNFRLYSNANIISDNGENLLIKEGRCDTVFRYLSGGTLQPAFRLDVGRYGVPVEAYLSFNPGVDMERYYMVTQLLNAPRYTFVSGYRGYGSSTEYLVFDGDDPAGGFSATGPEGEPGLFLGGVEFRPVYIRDNRLVGYMQALDIADDAESDVITDPQLKALAPKLKEDSNPVIVVAELKK